jgi:hypothetical protein
MTFLKATLRGGFCHMGLSSSDVNCTIDIDMKKDLVKILEGKQ